MLQRDHCALLLAGSLNFYGARIKRWPCSADIRVIQIVFLFYGQFAMLRNSQIIQSER